MMRLTTRLTIIALTLIFATIPSGDVINAAKPPTLFFDIQTSTGSDTLYVGVPTDIIFNCDPNGNIVLALVFPMEFVFSGSNLLGVLQPSNIIVTPEAAEIFELAHYANLSYWDGVGTDSLLVGFIDGGGDAWIDSAEVWRISTVPEATGTFHFDSIVLPPANWWQALDDNIVDLPIEIINYGHEYVVVFLTGDVNSDGRITTADIIYYVNWNYKGQAPPLLCDGIGDVNCSRSTTSADIIFLVNYVFLSGPAPCDITPLVPDTWVCP